MSQAAFAAALDEALVCEAIADQAGHRDHLQAVPLAEFGELRHARHGAVRVHDFADDAAGFESGQARQIDGGFGLPGANQHAAFARAQRKHVAGTRQIARAAAGAIAVRMVCARSAAEIPVVTPSAASIDSQNAVPKRDVFMGEISGRCSASQRSGASARQISPRPCVGHEVDRLGRDELGGHGEVAFVFAVFVVDHDQHAAGAEFLDAPRGWWRKAC